MLALVQQVGRVQTFVSGASRCLAGVHPARPDIGAVGDWVGEESVLRQAEAWLRDQGCHVARGPMELCSWFTYRVNDGPTVDEPFLMEPQERPERWMDAGYSDAAHYTSTLMPHEPILTQTQTLSERLRSEGWSIQSLPRGPDGTVPELAYRSAIARIHTMAHEAFADAFGFCPIPVQVMQELYAPYRAVIDPDLVFIASAPDGTDAGFLFGIGDLAAPHRKWAIIKTSAIRPRYAGRRIGTWLNATAHLRFRRKGYNEVVYALMWEGSASQGWSRYGGRSLRRYRLLQRSLNPNSSE